MRGALTEAPRMVEPVMKIPHAAPRMHRVRDKAEPKPAKKKGFTLDSTVPQSLFPTNLETIAAVVAIRLVYLGARAQKGVLFTLPSSTPTPRQPGRFGRVDPPNISQCISPCP